MRVEHIQAVVYEEGEIRHIACPVLEYALFSYLDRNDACSTRLACSIAPCHESLALSFEILGNFIVEMPLKFPVFLDAELILHCPYTRTVCPVVSLDFITTAVDIFSREQVRHLIEDIVDELHCLGLGDIHNLICRSQSAFHLNLLAGSSEIAIAGDCCRSMCQDLDFRNDGDMEFLCELNDFLHIGLSIMAFVRFIVEFVAYPIIVLSCLRTF